MTYDKYLEKSAILVMRAYAAYGIVLLTHVYSRVLTRTHACSRGYLLEVTYNYNL